MDNINLLWKLQSHRNDLNEVKRSFEKDEKKQEIQKMGRKLSRIDKKLEKLDESIKDSEKNLLKNNSLLKNYDYEVTTREKDLYEGNITDLKQLKFLDEERESIQKQIDKKELEVITEMEEIEESKIEEVEMKQDFQSLREEYTSLIIDYRIFESKYGENLNKIKTDMENVSLEIDDDVLKRYNELGGSMKNPMVEVVNNQCLGCNMLIPTFLVDEVKNHNKVVYCESCGRILYIDEK